MDIPLLRSFHRFLFALLLVWFGCAAEAQTATFTGNRTVVYSSATLAPAGMALDSAGNVYIADDSSNSILKVPAGGGSPVTVASGLASPSAVAVDTSGNVFVAQPGTTSNGSIIEFPWNGTKYGSAVTITSGISTPSAVVVDTSDDVFFLSSAGGYVGAVPVTSWGTKTPGILGSGLKNPSGLAIDVASNLFVADTGNNRVVALGFNGSSYGTPQQIATGLNGPWGIAVDVVDNVFVTDPADGQIVKIPSTSSAWGAPATLAAGFGAPRALALDGSGDFFVGDTGDEQVIELQPYAVNFGSANVCAAGQTTPAPCSQTIALNYHFSAFPTSVGVSATTLGAENLDFNFDAANSSCTESPSGGQDCALSIVFAPVYPGARRGAVQVFDGESGDLLATTPVLGNGNAPQIGFLDSTPALLASSGTINPLTGMAVDGEGNIYIANGESNIVYELNSQGEYQTTLGSGLSNPSGLAVDGAGDLFIADWGNARIVEVPAGGGPQVNIPTATAPQSIAIDGAGNIYFTNPLAARIIELPVGGGTPIALGSGLHFPAGIALDAAGDIFVADFGNNRVVKILPGGTQTVVGNGLNVQAEGVAVDAAGNVFIADGESKQIVEYTAKDGILLPLAKNLTELEYLTNDSMGNVYYINGAGAYSLPLALPPSYTFANTKVGSVSTDSPNGGAVQNTGNRPLVFSSSSGGADPSYPVNFPEYTDSGSCYVGISLAPGASCDVAIDFQPSVGGTIHASVVLTDNSLNQPNAIQSIAVSGTAPQIAPLINWATPAPINAGTPLSATQLDASSQVAGTFTYSPKLGTVLPAGWNKLTATFVPVDTADYTTATVSVNLWVANVLKIEPKVTWATPGAIVYGTALGAAQLKATASVAGSFAYSPAAGTVLAAGAPTLSVTFKPTDGANYATVTASVKIQVNPALLTITATNESAPYGQALPKFTFTASGFVHGDTTKVLSGAPAESTTAKKGSPVGTYPITIAKGTLSAANYTFAFKNGTLTIKSLGTAATPVIKPAAATYKGSVSVTITDATAGAVIHYTTNGSTPTAASAKYAGAISVKSTETIKANAIAPGYTNSAVATAKYTID